MDATESIFIGTAARELGVPPHRLTLAVYQGIVPERLAPKVESRRVIKRSDLPEIRRLIEGRINARAAHAR